jgi:flagellar motor switch protein FliN/FliY
MADTTTAQAPNDTPAAQADPATAAPDAQAQAQETVSAAPAEVPADAATDNNDQPAEAPLVEASEAAFPQVAPCDAKGPGGQIGILLDTSMPITVTLGQVEISIKDLLSLSAGAVLKLDKQVGEPADLYLRGIKFATGHLVVVGDQLGVKIHEILPAVADGAGAN